MRFRGLGPERRAHRRPGDRPGRPRVDVRHGAERRRGQLASSSSTRPSAPATPSPSTTASRAPTRVRCGSRTARTARRRGRLEAFELDRPAPGAASRCPGRSSTSCTSARSRPRAPSTPRSSRLDHLVGARRRHRRGDAARDVPGPVRLGLRRRRPVRRARAVRRSGRRSAASSTPATRAASASASTSSTTTSGRAATTSASSGPYFTDRYGTPWGAALNLDDADSDEVRRFIIDNALMWLRDFHVDGLRLDAVHALFDDPGRSRCWRSCPAEVSALVGRARPAAVADRRVRPQRPADRHAARGRRPRPARAVGRRRPPRACTCC